MRSKPFEIGGHVIQPGEQKTIDIPLAAMATHNTIDMTVHVIHGKQEGPRLFISAAIHGDELNGVDIIRRMLKQKQLKRIKGTIIAIPVVNVHGFITHSRYLPDGRDLNRSFPGSSKGSLAGRMANTFLKEIVQKCTHGIDLHTAARHRDNLPQIRADLSSEVVKAMALKFELPVIIDSKIRDGSLRQAAGDAGIPIILYEAGEALRFNEVAIRAGLRGIIGVMRELGMLPSLKKKEVSKPSIVSTNTSWVRAPYSGILRALVPLGGKAEKGSILGVIADPLGENEYQVVAPEDGIVIGRTNLPLVYEGDALFHLAYYHQKVDAVLDQVESFQEKLEPDYSMNAPLDPEGFPIQ
ncbi:succinylglutamate desuccinylase/aspartoacylase family protein [Oceanicoccus sp. KOV_DT_Chl]|uniref:succinylglutamate desuccinylase/aspartoacylase family protein n=1 Tax=Oceanicoccus sp. KOV_DT_Chl TaxID=1904639 RepID=UPI000C7AEF2D|nr:succinylglutamate desuccinylase/aspartoacylase family protein [Oceanicoccus sp. KOV_DT_Chl]